MSLYFKRNSMLSKHKRFYNCDNEPTSFFRLNAKNNLKSITILSKNVRSM